jgi:F-type H+-transporting ATPase subunit b
MMRRWPLLLLLVAVPLVLGAAGEEGASHPSATMDFLGKVVNFIILFGALIFVLRKPVKALLAKRTADVGETLRRAGVDRTESESRAATSREKLSGLEDEVRALKSAAEEEGRRAAERIARAAREEAERLKKFTRQELDEQVRLVVRELKAYATAQAADLARERIRRRLTPKTQSALIDKSIDRLSKLYDQSGPR